MSTDNCLKQLSSKDRELLITSFHAKQAFFWIGSGFSKNFGYTSWTGILEKLASRFQYTGVLPDNPLRCAELLSAVAVKSGLDSEKFSEEVCRQLQKSRAKIKRPTWSADFARLASDVIVTTNWDHVLEEDIFDGYANVIIRRVSSSQLDRAGRNILKIHGDMDFPQSLVFTHSQYNAFQREDNYLSRKVYTLFAEMTPVFLGYSLSDPNIFFLFDEALVDANNANRAYMIIPESTPNDEYEEYRLILKHKGVSIIKADIGDFLKAVEEGLEDIKGTISDFRTRYKNVLPRIEKIVAAAKEGRPQWSSLAKDFKGLESGKAVFNAMAEFLQNPDLYQSLGGALSSFDQKIPGYANHVFSQVGIAISNNLNIRLPNEFSIAVIANALDRLNDRDFHSAREPFVDLMSLHVVAPRTIFVEKINALVNVMNWSAPRYNRGYCWATWEAFFEHVDWLTPSEKEAIVERIGRDVAADGLSEDTRRWLEPFSKYLDGKLKDRVDEMLVPF